MRSARTRSLPIALLMAAVVLLLSAASAAAATIPIQGGEVDWGVKESFRKYVKGPIANGKIEVSGGAVEAADGTFVFPVGSGKYDLTTHVTEVQATGTVHFTGHYEGTPTPQLDVTITNPRVVFGGETGTVFADVFSKAFSPGEPESFPERRIRGARHQRGGPRLQLRSGDDERDPGQTHQRRLESIRRLLRRRHGARPGLPDRRLRADRRRRRKNRRKKSRSPPIRPRLPPRP